MATRHSAHNVDLDKGDHRRPAALLCTPPSDDSFTIQQLVDEAGVAAQRLLPLRRRDSYLALLVAACRFLLAIVTADVKRPIERLRVFVTRPLGSCGAVTHRNRDHHEHFTCTSCSRSHAPTNSFR
jgi:hypothetical protein